MFLLCGRVHVLNFVFTVWTRPRTEYFCCVDASTHYIFLLCGRVHTQYFFAVWTRPHTVFFYYVDAATYKFFLQRIFAMHPQPTYHAAPKALLAACLLHHGHHAHPSRGMLERKSSQIPCFLLNTVGMENTAVRNIPNIVSRLEW